MKKIFLTMLVSSSLLIASAQDLHFGVQAGAIFANYKWSADNFSMTGDTKVGFTVGGLVDIPLSTHFSVQPALNFVQKGTKSTDDLGGGVTETDKINVNLLEIPVNFLFNSRGSSGNLFVGVGPSIAFALSGKSEAKFSDNTPSEKTDIKFGDTDNDDMKGLDFGANFLAGYGFSNGLMISVNYNLGLSNLIPKPVDNEKMKSHYFGVKLGWMFGGSGSGDKK